MSDEYAAEQEGRGGAPAISGLVGLVGEIRTCPSLVGRTPHHGQRLLVEVHQGSRTAASCLDGHHRLALEVESQAEEVAAGPRLENG